MPSACKWILSNKLYLLLQEEKTAINPALYDALPTDEDELDAEPAMLTAVQLVEKAASLFKGDRHSRLQAVFCCHQLGNGMQKH